MANEITKNTGLVVVKGVRKLNVKSEIRKYTMAGTKMFQFEQTIGTTYEPIVFPADLGTIGELQILNLDPTNYVEIGLEVSAAFYPFSKMPGGTVPRSADFPWGGTLFAKANTAPVAIQVSGCEI